MSFNYKHRDILAYCRKEIVKLALSEFDDEDEYGEEIWRAVIYVYLDEVTRNYGGPEEGGWWYDSGLTLACYPVIVEFDVQLKPNLPEAEMHFLSSLVSKWLVDFPSLNDSNRGSVSGRRDFLIKFSVEPPPSNWSEPSVYS